MCSINLLKWMGGAGRWLLLWGVVVFSARWKVDIRKAKKPDRDEDWDNSTNPRTCDCYLGDRIRELELEWSGYYIPTKSAQRHVSISCEGSGEVTYADIYCYVYTSIASYRYRDLPFLDAPHRGFLPVCRCITEVSTPNSLGL